MSRISFFEGAILLAWLLLLGFIIRFTTVTLLDRNPDSKLGAALAFVH